MIRWTELRFLAVLKRIAIAMEEANKLERHRQEIEYAPLKDRGPGPAKTVVISRPTVEEWNKK